MALGIRRKGSRKPQAQAPPPPPPAPAAPAAIPADWREQLTATKPKGRFKYGENVGGSRR